MTRRGRTWQLLTTALAVLVGFGLASPASAGDQVGTSFPSDFPVINDASLGVPVIGFGAAGRVQRTPVIFLHGNNDTPFPTPCNPFGYIHAMAQFFADHATRPASSGGSGTRAISAI